MAVRRRDRKCDRQEYQRSLEPRLTLAVPQSYNAKVLAQSLNAKPRGSHLAAGRRAPLLISAIRLISIFDQISHLLDGKHWFVSVDHAITVRADRSQIMRRICMSRVSVRMKWLKLVYFDELAAAI